MYRRTTTVINRTGLHARPASQFTNAAKAFDSRISIRNLSLKEQDKHGKCKVYHFRADTGAGAGLGGRADGRGPRRAAGGGRFD